MGSTQRRTTWHRTGPAVLAVSALALAGCGTQVAGSGAGGLAPLRIGTVSAGSLDAAPAKAGSGASTDPYPLQGTLPTGPGEAPVYRYEDGQIQVARVSALAAALGVTTVPTRHAFGWAATSKTGTVLVRDSSGQWSFTRAGDTCPSYSVDIDHADGYGGSVGCAVAIPPTVDIAATPCASEGLSSTDTIQCPDSGTDSGTSSGGGTDPSARPTATPAVPAPTDDVALSVARPVLDAAGVPSGDATVLEPYGTSVAVIVDPAVDGLPTMGIRTVVDVDHDGVSGATGYLATPKIGPSYPLVSAADALERLRTMPRPELGMPCQQGKDCLGIAPQIVTGAVLGLALRDDAGTAVLVPSWFFSLKGSPEAMPVIAVQDKYIADPVQVDPGSGSTEPGATSPPDPGTGGGSEPGSEAPGPPAGEDPSGPVAGGPVITKVALGKDATTLLVSTVVGVCEDYSAAAQESATRITITITGTPRDPAMACVAMAKEITLEVRLSAPWDNRTVIDAATGRPVPVS